MPPDDLLPYPLAGANSSDERGAVAGPAHRRGVRLPGAVTALALGTVLALLVAVVLLWGQHRADQQRLAEAADRLAAAESAGERSARALHAAVADPLTTARAFSAEMVVASAAVGRFRVAADQPGAAVDDALFLRTFFRSDVQHDGWLPLTGRGHGVVARVDRPREPGTVWVSRLPSATGGAQAPTTATCLELDVAAIVESVAGGRIMARAVDTAPLRWWPDVYRFAPVAECRP